MERVQWACVFIFPVVIIGAFLAFPQKFTAPDRLSKLKPVPDKPAPHVDAYSLLFPVCTWVSQVSGTKQAKSVIAKATRGKREVCIEIDVLRINHTVYVMHHLAHSNGAHEFFPLVEKYKSVVKVWYIDYKESQFIDNSTGAYDKCSYLQNLHKFVTKMHDLVGSPGFVLYLYAWSDQTARLLSRLPFHVNVGYKGYPILDDNFVDMMGKHPLHSLLIEKYDMYKEHYKKLWQRGKHILFWKGCSGVTNNMSGCFGNRAPIITYIPVARISQGSLPFDVTTRPMIVYGKNIGVTKSKDYRLRPPCRDEWILW